MKRKILSIGEIIWDVYPDKKTIGGAPLNFAAHAVLCGADSTLISAVGNDTLGDAAMEALSGFGVGSKYIRKNDKPTGQCVVTLDANAIPRYQVLRNVAYDEIELGDADFAAFNRASYDALYFGTLIQRESVSRRAVHALVSHCSFRNILCDVNLRQSCYDSDSVGFCLRHATILKLSMEEEPLLRASGGYIPQDDTPRAVALALCKRYPQLEAVIVTLGKDGSYLYTSEDKREYRQAAIGDTVVSTVGAGDSFAAAWLVSYLQQMPMEQCMKRAAEVSGFVVAHAQAVPFYKM